MNRNDLGCKSEAVCVLYIFKAESFAHCFIWLCQTDAFPRKLNRKFVPFLCRVCLQTCQPLFHHSRSFKDIFMTLINDTIIGKVDCDSNHIFLKTHRYFLNILNIILSQDISLYSSSTFSISLPPYQPLDHLPSLARR